MIALVKSAMVQVFLGQRKPLSAENVMALENLSPQEQLGARNAMAQANTIRNVKNVVAQAIINLNNEL